jgi:amino-acid N-acetyltransferase
MLPSIAPEALNPEITALLEQSGLPAADLQQGSPAQLFTYRYGGQLTGVAGLEFYGKVALLRSLAVQPEARGQGTGAWLLSFAEQTAREAGVEALYLLTETASSFFAQQGYTTCVRAAAPEAIAGTSQFALLCPASAIFMCKMLAAS